MVLSKLENFHDWEQGIACEIKVSVLIAVLYPNSLGYEGEREV